MRVDSVWFDASQMIERLSQSANVSVTVLKQGDNNDIKIAGMRVPSGMQGLQPTPTRTATMPAMSVPCDFDSSLLCDSSSSSTMTPTSSITSLPALTEMPLSAPPGHEIYPAREINMTSKSTAAKGKLPSPLASLLPQMAMTSSPKVDLGTYAFLPCLD
mmetsp:Transcript_84042/g.116091  ORF Transcript_84042/g.116091 Transcript_84042/m.116091 type:complete len:159 (-) Transcript_84042:142-618(-)